MSLLNLQQNRTKVVLLARILTSLDSSESNCSTGRHLWALPTRGDVYVQLCRFEVCRCRQGVLFSDERALPPLSHYLPHSILRRQAYVVCATLWMSAER